MCLTKKRKDIDMSTKEIVTIAGGVGGMQLSSAMWELFYQEYGIDADGQQSVAIPDLPMKSFFEVTEKKVDLTINKF